MNGAQKLNRKLQSSNICDTNKFKHGDHPENLYCPYKQYFTIKKRKEKGKRKIKSKTEVFRVKK